MTQHTPGPWYWVDARTQRHLTKKGMGSFAQVSMPMARREWSRQMIDKYEADARLIAAAPELLAALELVATEARKSERTDLLEIVLPAIAKAKGEV